MGEANWTDELDRREMAQVKHATHYADTHADAGVPGHGQFLLIAKLVAMLDRYYKYIPEQPRVIKVMFDDEANCWRDIVTGVKVDIP